MFGTTVTIEISRRCSGRETLNARTDRYRNHVLIQTLVIANAGITSSGEYIDKTIVDEDFQLYLGIRDKKARHDRWQHQPCSTHGNIQSQRARWLIAKAIYDIKR